VLPVASLFDLRVNFLQCNFNGIGCQGNDFKQVTILTTLQKRVLLVAPFFETGVDFGVFDTKIWVFYTRVLVLRSQFSLSHDNKYMMGKYWKKMCQFAKLPLGRQGESSGTRPTP
jgi:hypothetical protein